MQPVLERAALYLTCVSVTASFFSIAVSHICLGLAVVAVLLSGARLRFPPIALPLALFIAGTVLSLAFSEMPAEGRPQVRKLYVFLILLVASTTLRQLPVIRRLLLVCVGAASLSAARALVQFQDRLQRSREAGVDFSQFYIADRITGFMSHWMTFGSEMMMALLVLVAFVLFAPAGRQRLWLWLLCGGVMGTALVLGFTRGIWLFGAPVSLVYLLWRWKRRAVVLAPVAVLAGYLLSPAFVKERIHSVLRPRGQLDSNQHRVVTWRTGLRMIAAHPWLGLGPEHIRLRFERYVPEDVTWPLPDGWYGHLHNIYLHYAAERGLPTLLALLWILGKVLWDFRQAVARLPAGRSDARFVLHACMAITIGMLVVGCFELNLGDSEVLLLFLAIVSMGYVAQEEAHAVRAAG